MKRFKIWWRTLGLALLAGSAVVTWEFGRSTEDFAQRPATHVLPTASGVVTAPVENESLRQSDDVVAEATESNSSNGGLVAMVAARLREWEDQDEPELRDQRIQELETLLDGTNMMEIVQGLPPGLMNFAFGLPALQRWMAFDPRAAAEWMSSHPDIAEGRVEAIIEAWGQKNPAELQQYLDGLPEGEWKQQVSAAVSYGLLAIDPLEAIGWASRMGPGARQTGVLQLATTEWAKRDPEASSQWVSEMNDLRLREELVGSVAIGYAHIDPVDAAKWLIESSQSQEVMDRSVAEIAGAWATREPAAVAEWVTRFSEGQAQQMALGILVNEWGNRDRVALMVWIDGLTEGKLRTEATDLLAAIPFEASTQ